MNTPESGLRAECYRTADMLVDMAEKQGVYYAVAFLSDAGYDLKRLKALLPILEQTRGALK
ncbi:MAG: hypothetical protein V3R83_12385 [Gammaproteobacteria bacterium]